MDLTLGHNLPPTVQTRLRLLDWIADHGGTAPRQMVDLAALFAGQEHAPALAIAGHLEALEDQGLIRLQKTMGWEGWSCDVLAPGIDLIEQVQGRRRDLSQRQQAARDAILRWLYDRTLHDDVHPDSAGFAQSAWGTHYGDPFTSKEIERASEWLLEEGYIKGTPFAEGGVGLPMMAPKGERVVEQDRSVNSDAHQPAPYSVTTINITGSGNAVAANSTNVSQTTTVKMTEENSRQLLGLAESIAQLTNAGLLGLDQEHTQEAALVVQCLRDTAEQTDAPGGSLRTLLDKAKVVALAGTGTAIGQTLVAAVDQVIHALGLG